MTNDDNKQSFNQQKENKYQEIRQINEAYGNRVSNNGETTKQIERCISTSNTKGKRPQ